MGNSSFRRQAAVMAALLAGGAIPTTFLVSTPGGASPTPEIEDHHPSGDPTPVSAAAYDFGETLSKLDGRELEVTFLAGIIEHHQDAIDMAAMELERGESPDIRTHAEDIIAQQTHQIEQFTRWLAEWYGLTIEDAMAEMPAEAQEEMAVMEAESEQMMAELDATSPGRSFDVAFVQHMIPHHQAGIVEFLEPESRADHAELRVVASTGITVQQAEVADFRTWLSGELEEA